MKGNHTRSILIPALHYPPVVGGFEVFLENIATRVGRTRPVYVLTGKVAGTPKKEIHGTLEVRRSYSLFALQDRSYSSWWYICTTLPVLFFGTLLMVLRKRNVLLHANGFFNGILCYAIYLCTHAPYVMTIQSADFTIYHPEVRLNLLIRLQRSLERIVYRHAMTCHAVSNDLCQHYRNQGVDTCIMIPNGIETDMFFRRDDAEKRATRKRFGIPEDVFCAVNVSRLESKNGVGDSIAALVNVREAHLVVVGDGSYRKSLQEKVKELGLDDRVYFVGEQTRENVADIIGMADVFIRTPFSEGFGIVFLEAMASGVPVIAAGVGGILDFVKNNETGLVAHPGNVEEIGNALRRLYEDETLRERLATSGEQLAKTKYNWERITEELEKRLYNGV